MTQRFSRTYPNLRAYFDESGETQQAFAQRLNRTQSWVSKVVNGHLEPSIEEALQIAKMAKVPLESLAKPVSAEK